MVTTPPADISAAQAIRAFINELSARDDVIVHERRYGSALETKKELPAARSRFAPDMVAFCEVMNGLRFIWDFKDAYDPDSSPGLHGGRIVINPLYSKRSFQRNDPGFSFPADTWFYVIDEHISEGMGYVVYREGEEPRRFEYVFARAGEESEARFVAGSFDGYIHKAIERAFTWYWPLKDPDGEATLARLRERPARLRPAFEIEVLSWEPIDTRAFRLERLHENAQYRKLGRVLKQMGETVSRKETPNELSERLVGRLDAFESFDDATISVLYDESTYGIAGQWDGEFRKLPPATQRQRLEQYYRIGRAEPMVKAEIALRPLVTLGKELHWSTPGLVALLLSQAPGAQVERVVTHTTLWDYLPPARLSGELNEVLLAPLGDTYSIDQQIQQSKTARISLTLRADIFPDLRAGATWTAGALIT